MCKPYAGEEALKWDSGHIYNVFQAKTVGYGNNTIVSCARDGQVQARGTLICTLPTAVTRARLHRATRHSLFSSFNAESTHRGRTRTQSSCFA